LYPIAYSGIEKAKGLLISDKDPNLDTLTDAWAIPDQATETMVHGSFLLGSAQRLGLIDEERKVSLNGTSAEILSRLFQSAAGLSRERADEGAYCLIDWRDSDSFFGHPQYGAETSYYEGLRAPYKAADKPYQLLDEMLLVKGMTAEIYEKIKPFLTVYGSGQVNIKTAPREVLSALGFSPEAVEIIARYRAGVDGADGTADDNFFSSTGVILTDLSTKGETPLDASQEVVLGSLLASSRLSVSSTVFSVLSRAVLAKNGASVEAEAVIDRKGRIHHCRMGEVKL
jgi:hypothetical protein